MSRAAAWLLALMVLGACRIEEPPIQVHERLRAAVDTILPAHGDGARILRFAGLAAAVCDGLGRGRGGSAAARCDALAEATRGLVQADGTHEFETAMRRAGGVLLADVAVLAGRSALAAAYRADPVSALLDVDLLFEDGRHGIAFVGLRRAIAAVESGGDLDLALVPYLARLGPRATP